MVHVDYLTAAVGFPLGIILGMTIVFAYYVYAKGATVESTLRRSVLATSAVAAGIAYYLRKQPCRSSLFGGLAAGLLFYYGKVAYTDYNEYKSHQ